MSDVQSRRLTDAEDEERLKVLLREASEEGARKALKRIGLEDEKAFHDMRELRSLIESWRLVKKTTTQTVVRAITFAILGLITAGIYFKTGVKP
jgi:hypothetical protein